MTLPGSDVSVRVLHLEDDALDAELVRIRLREGGVNAHILRVETTDEYAAALDRGGLDVILSDFSGPGFDGITALTIARQRRAEIPFIFVSGTMGEETAIEALKRGAADYVLKDRLSRLPTAVTRSLREAVERQRLRDAEARLSESEERFRRFMEASPTAAYVKDVEGRLVYANPAAARFVGLPVAELLGKSCNDLYPAKFAAPIRANDLRVAAGERVEATEVIPASDGSLHYWSVYKFPIRGSAGELLIASVAMDVTEKKRLEEQYLHAQKLEAVGRLAGGVAHDFNNLLTVIGGYADLISMSVASDPVTSAQVEEIRNATQRATALTRQLLAFSRQDVVQPVVLNLNDLIVRMGNMLRRLIGEDVQLEIRTAPKLASVKADPGQIEQIVMNLVVNARDATRSGGTITVRTADVPWEAMPECHDPELGSGPHVLVSVSDSGTGMSRETLARVFEPFFTTKERGKGTGLGLATVHGIVKQSGGQVRVTSELGRGSTFDVYLPAVAGTAPARRPTSTPGEAPRGAETVLVAEDNRTVRALVRQILERNGYTVITAQDGAAAAAAFDSHPETIDLLVTDVVMPRMGGIDLMEEARRRHPGLRVLFLSGYADRDTASRIEIRPGTAYLQKPFSADVLLRKVREVLAEATA